MQNGDIGGEMEILNGILDLTQALILLLIVIWLIQIERKIKPNDEPPKPLFKFKDKPKEPTPEEIRYSKILDNIESYGGSGKGQVKI
jgi:hypothetical protein